MTNATKKRQAGSLEAVHERLSSEFESEKIEETDDEAKYRLGGKASLSS